MVLWVMSLVPLVQMPAVFLPDHISPQLIETSCTNDAVKEMSKSVPLQSPQMLFTCKKKTSVLGPVSSRTGHKASGTFGFNRIQTEISLEEGRFTQYQPMSPQTCYVLMLVNWYLCELVDVGEHQPNHTKPTPRSSFLRFGHEHRVLGGFPVLFGSLLTRHPALPSSG